MFWIYHYIFNFLFLLTVFFTAGAAEKPVLLLGHGSDTWKTGKILTDGNIASRTIRTWPSSDVYSAYSAVYIGESVQGIALKAWSDTVFDKVRKYVSGGGILILTGDVPFFLTGNELVLAEKYAEFLGFKSFVHLPGDPAEREGFRAGTAGIPADQNRSHPFYVHSGGRAGAESAVHDAPRVPHQQRGRGAACCH